MSIFSTWKYILVILLFSCVTVHSDSFTYQRYSKKKISTNLRVNSLSIRGISSSIEKRAIEFHVSPARGSSIQTGFRSTNSGTQRINFPTSNLSQNWRAIQSLGRPRINTHGINSPQSHTRQTGLLQQRIHGFRNVSTYMRSRPQSSRSHGITVHGNTIGNKYMQPSLGFRNTGHRNNQRNNLLKSLGSTTQKISPIDSRPLSLQTNIKSDKPTVNFNRPSSFLQSPQTTFRPPNGYKVTYCKTYNKTHQLVTLAPVTPKAILIPKYVSFRNRGIPRPNYAINRVPHNIPTKYIMVRKEDYVICSRSYLPPTRQPIVTHFTQSRRPSFVHNTHYPTSSPFIHTYIPKGSVLYLKPSLRPYNSNLLNNRGKSGTYNKSFNSPLKFRSIPPIRSPIQQTRNSQSVNFKSSSVIRSFPKKSNAPKSSYKSNIRRPIPARSPPQSVRRLPLRPNKQFPKFPLPSRNINYRNQKSQYTYRRAVSNTRVVSSSNYQHYSRTLNFQKPLSLPNRMPFTKRSPLKMSTPSISGILSNVFRNLPTLLKVPNLRPPMYRPPPQHQSIPQQSPQQNQEYQRIYQNKVQQRTESKPQLTTSLPFNPTIGLQNHATQGQTIELTSSKSPSTTSTSTPRVAPSPVPAYRRVRKERIRLIIPKRFKEEIDENEEERERILEIAMEEENERRKRSLSEMQRIEKRTRR